MDSILTNSAALSALQSLNMTQQDMNITQNQVSTGLAVATAADNAAYWSIGQQLTSASGIETAANTALQQSQAIMDTANSAISSVITTIDAIQAAITGASNPGASFADINYLARFAVEPAERRDQRRFVRRRQPAQWHHGTSRRGRRRQCRSSPATTRAPAAARSARRLHGPGADRRHERGRPTDRCGSGDDGGHRHQPHHDSWRADRFRRHGGQRQRRVFCHQQPGDDHDDRRQSGRHRFDLYRLYISTIRRPRQDVRRPPTPRLRRPTPQAPTCGRCRRRRRRRPRPAAARGAC